jgi:hypothetical protein
VPLPRDLLAAQWNKPGLRTVECAFREILGNSKNSPSAQFCYSAQHQRYSAQRQRYTFGEFFGVIWGAKKGNLKTPKNARNGAIRATIFGRASHLNMRMCLFIRCRRNPILPEITRSVGQNLPYRVHARQRGRG